MPEDDEGNQTPPPSDKKPEPNPNRIASMKERDVALYAVELEKKVARLEADLKKVTAERDAANRTIAADIRARKIDEILENSNFTVEDLDDKSLDELDAITSTLRMAKKAVKPIGNYGRTDEPSPQSGMDDLFAPWRKK